MEGAEYLDAIFVKELSPHLSDGSLAFEERVAGDSSQTNDVFWLNDLQLSFKKASTILLLVRCWIPVPWWTTFDGVENVYLVTCEAHRFDDFIK